MPKISYMGDGTTTEFNFNFPYFEDDNIIVTKNNESATGYTIVGTSAGLNADIPYTGGKVVFNIAPTALDNITISRSLPLTRIVDYQPTEKINPTLLNQDINYTIEVLKDMSTELNDFHTQYASIIDKTETQTLLARIDEIDEKIEETNQTITDFYTDIQNGRIMSKDDFYSHAPNCITEIPQNIKIQIGNNNIVIKSSSKVYVPNGTNNFTTYTVASDASLTPGTYTDTYMLFIRSNASLLQISKSNCFSGTTEPTGISGWNVWYDTTNNNIKLTTDGGSTWESGVSLPLGIISTVANTSITLNQIFNGFGYIGTSVFALPGTKALIPNGFNANGTMKNSTVSVGTVSVKTATTVGNDMVLRIYNNGSLFWGTSTNLYDSLVNYNKAAGSIDNCCYFGTITTTTGGVITSFNTKTVFKYAQ